MTTLSGTSASLISDRLRLNFGPLLAHISYSRIRQIFFQITFALSLVIQPFYSLVLVWTFGPCLLGVNRTERRHSKKFLVFKILWKQKIPSSLTAKWHQMQKYLIVWHLILSIQLNCLFYRKKKQFLFIILVG